MRTDGFYLVLAVDADTGVVSYEERSSEDEARRALAELRLDRPAVDIRVLRCDIITHSPAVRP